MKIRSFSYYILLTLNFIFVLITLIIKFQFCSGFLFIMLAYMLFIFLISNLMDGIVVQLFYCSMLGVNYIYLDNRKSIIYRITSLLVSTILYILSIFQSGIFLVAAIFVLSIHIVKKNNSILIDQSNMCFITNNFTYRVFLRYIDRDDNGECLRLRGNDNNEYQVPVNKNNKDAIEFLMMRYKKTFSPKVMNKPEYEM